MNFWDSQIKKYEKHALYRYKRLALMHNSDYLNAHANEAKEFARGSDKEAIKRIQDTQAKRHKYAFALNVGSKVKRLSHG